MKFFQTPLVARVISVTALICLLAVWMFVLWPGVGGLSLIVILPSWANWVLVAVFAAVSAAAVTQRRSSGKLGRFAPIFVGLGLTFGAGLLASNFLCESVTSGRCVDAQTGSFIYSFASLMMIFGGGLLFSGVLSPVDTSQCDCNKEHICSTGEKI